MNDFQSRVIGTVFHDLEKQRFVFNQNDRDFVLEFPDSDFRVLFRHQKVQRRRLVVIGV